jgi:hypothetical protein
MLIHMYHEIQQPFALLYNLASALKPGARVGIVDTTRSTAEHGTPPPLLRCEMEAMGYRQIEFHLLEGSQTYLAIFKLPQGREPTPSNAILPCRVESWYRVGTAAQPPAAATLGKRPEVRSRPHTAVARSLLLETEAMPPASPKRADKARKPSGFASPGPAIRLGPTALAIARRRNRHPPVGRI